VVDRPEQASSFAVVDSGFDREHALADLRDELVERQQLRGAVRDDAESMQRGCGDDNRGETARLGKASLDVAAQFGKPQIGTERGELDAAARGAGGDRAPGGDLGEGGADEDVPRVSARRIEDGESRVGSGREVLGGVHGDVGNTCGKRGADIAGEGASPGDGAQWDIVEPVADGRHHDWFYVEVEQGGDEFDLA
jgi:hypothetical protein